MIDIATAKRLRRLSRRKREGMTLIEIMIVVIIMALIATAVGVAVLPRLQKARVETARTDIQNIRSALTLWEADNPGGQCPSVADLTENGYIDRQKSVTDPWDNEYHIECTGSDFVVTSAGEDGQMGTEDDVS